MVPDDPTAPTGTQIPLAALGAAPAQPGLVVVWEGHAPACRVVAVAGRELVLGRSSGCDVILADGAVSRRHAVVGIERGRLFALDLGSTAGVRVDGRAITERTHLDDGAVVALGEAVLIARADVGPLARARVRVVDGYVVGPSMAAAIAAVELAAATGRGLLVTGESGSGKEHLARRYHASGRRAGGPFIDVNCAELDRELGRADLFGARKGAYSGSVGDRDGYLVRADGGTLFLDEVGELDLEVQAMLLRVLETRKVTPIGASTARAVDLGVVAATNRDLRERVAAGKFRQDLFVRLAPSRVVVPALRERREEIPWLVSLAVARAWREIVETPAWASLGKEPWPVSRALVEAMLLADSTGSNARGVLAEAGDAVYAAVTTRAGAIDAIHLRAETRASAAAGEASQPEQDSERARLEAAMARNGGSLPRAAAECGISRSRAYRLMGRG